MTKSKAFGFVLVLPFAAVVAVNFAHADDFVAKWPKTVKRTWTGPAFWANRLQDWRTADGRLECITAGPGRNVVLLTRELSERASGFNMSVRLGRLDHIDPLVKGWAGFRFGTTSHFGEFHNKSVHRQGIDAGINTKGQLFIGKAEMGKTHGADATEDATIALPIDDIELRLMAKPNGDPMSVTLTAHNPKDGRPLAKTTQKVALADCRDLLALVCHSNEKRPSGVRFWFANWKVSGDKIDALDDHAFGPILFAQHTLSNRCMKMTAQMPPISEKDAQTVQLQIKKSDGDAWQPIAKAKIDKLSRTATFRIEDWDSSRDTPYRLVYSLIDPDDKPWDYYWTGTVRHDPVDKQKIVVAAFTGNNDFGWPNTDVVKHVSTHRPDFLVFTGDQIYERIAGYGVQRKPLDKACLDYLRKWYIFGWSYRELMRDIPSACLPDDHDVYHGNLWGAGGFRGPDTPAEGSYPVPKGPLKRRWNQDRGGYMMPTEWVRMVERTQTSHLPDPYDPTPIANGIGVYYCAMTYGGISFAVIEDRKFKSAPSVAVPEGKFVNGWSKNPDFDPVTQADVPGAILLGERQLRFLRDWAADYSDGVWMKVVLSQTVFANVATLPKPANTDSVVPKLPIPAPGEYPAGDYPVADGDSNGWPQSGRNRALREMRRGYAFHIAGDQHLGSTVQYGIDDFHDAGFAVCVPAVANVWPRRWFPHIPGQNQNPGEPRYTGDYLDGFGNRMTVHAVSNPVISGHEPAALHDRATGYGIVTFDRNDRTIDIACWPRYSDPTDPSTGGTYPGWPITINQADNYGRKAVAFLPTLEVKGMRDPVVQIVDESNGEIVYTLRIKGTRFRPKVFNEGTYTIHIGEPGTSKMKKIENVQAAIDKADTIQVTF